MAEKTTKAPKTTAQITGQSDNLAKARAARDAAAQTDKFVYAGQVKEGTKKLAPQAQVIVNAIQAAGKGGITRSQLVENLNGILTTRQPIGRIVSYYQKALVETGYVAMTASAPAKAA